MSNLKATKRAFLSGIIAIVLCISMLVGTTFAWFTDTASTAVNKIQAGTLDVALEMKNASDEWENAEGKTLKWVAADGRAQENILWEPGCTYELPELRVVNKGNLALKYKMVVTGINGNAKLLEVISFTYGTDINGVEIDLEDEVHLAPGATVERIIIKGHMAENAGNEYQGLSIDGIGITVVATQYTYEYDSINNQYDKEAVIPVKSNAVGNLTVTDTSTQNNAVVSGEAQTISDGVMSVTYPAGVTLDNTTAVTGDTEKKTSVTQNLTYVGETAS
ncbi:MAG: TasA family protein, partial [Candidatus Scatosoma sp.]